LSNFGDFLKKTIPHNVAIMWSFFFQKEKEKKRKENKAFVHVARAFCFLPPGMRNFAKTTRRASRASRVEKNSLHNSNAHTRSSKIPSIRLLKLERSS